MMLKLHRKTPDLIAVRIEGEMDQEGSRRYSFKCIGSIEWVMMDAGVFVDDWHFDDIAGRVVWTRGGVEHHADIGDWLVSDGGDVKRFTSWAGLLKDYRIERGIE